MTSGNSKKFLKALGSVLLLVVGISFAVAKLMRKEPVIEIGEVATVQGKVETSPDGGTRWTGVVPGDKMKTGATIRTGMNSSLTLTGEAQSFVLGPDTELTVSSREGMLHLMVTDGEVDVTQEAKDRSLSVQLDDKSLTATGSTRFLVTRLLQSRDLAVRVVSGAITIHDKNSKRDVTPASEPVIIGPKTQKMLYALSPLPGHNFPDKEGVAAVIFEWKGPTPTKSAEILLRNLKTGELSIHDAEKTPTELVLPSGQYAWSLNTEGMVSSSRLFSVAGEGQDTVEVDSTPQTAATDSTDGAATSSNPAAGEEITAKDRDDPVPTKAQVEPTQNLEAKAPIKGPILTIVAPKTGKKIPLKGVTEQRIRWDSKDPMDSIEMEILGSSGNPTFRFTLGGDRTRRRLPEMPPGRYTIRVRANVGTGDAAVKGPWSEIYVDVIQTEAGELAPTDVKATLSKTGKRREIIVEWSKSSAAQYQVTVTNPKSPAVIVRQTKSRVIVPAPKIGKATVTVCALDANQQVRGCAPEVSAQ